MYLLGGHARRAGRRCAAASDLPTDLAVLQAAGAGGARHRPDRGACIRTGAWIISRMCAGADRSMR